MVPTNKELKAITNSYNTLKMILDAMAHCFPDATLPKAEKKAALILPPPDPEIIFLLQDEEVDAHSMEHRSIV